MKRSISILISANLFMFFAVGMTVWFLYTIVNSGEELQKRVELIATENAKVKAHTELARLIEATQKEREELSEYVLSQDSTSNFLTSIESAGASIGVSLVTQTLKVVPQDGKFDSLSVEFVVIGNETTVRQMLSVFESLPYHSRVQTLSVAKTADGTVKTVIGLTVTLAKYD